MFSWDRNPEEARRRHATTLRGFAAALVAVASVCLSLPASAQPDPFTDYDAMKSGQTPPPPLLEPGADPLPPPSAEPQVSAAPWKWTWNRVNTWIERSIWCRICTPVMAAFAR